jgi:hypothetical protein
VYSKDTGHVRGVFNKRKAVQQTRKAYTKQGQHVMFVTTFAC